MILFAMRYFSGYVDACKEYLVAYEQPEYVNVLTTVPPGTTEKIRYDACHSTTRGLHPNLKEGLLTIPKHIGGPRARQIATIYRKSGIRCVVNVTAKTTEVAHILNNIAYGVNLVLADEMQGVCRHYGVDYYDSVMRYTETNNEGYTDLGHPSKVRMVLTPPNGNIGGHCVKMSAGLIPEENRGTLINTLAKY
jgi:UDP-N-acetyl-D-mannosaminuronate dehydrogenase